MKKHRIVSLTTAGEKTRVENSWTVTCLCGFQESCSTKKETLREYSLHINSVVKPICMHCKEKPAKVPEIDPRFCSIHCGFSYGSCIAQYLDWCNEHKLWYNGYEGGCTDCV